jgi:hypothetical protein
MGDLDFMPKLISTGDAPDHEAMKRRYDKEMKIHRKLSLKSLTVYVITFVLGVIVGWWVKPRKEEQSYYDLIEPDPDEIEKILKEFENRFAKAQVDCDKSITIPPKETQFIKLRLKKGI